jgi:hypothetical protein
MANPEHAPTGIESAAEKHRDLERAPEILDKRAEKVGEESKEQLERSVEKAREEANKEALSGREVSKGEHKNKADTSAAAPSSRDESYKHTMKRVQSELSGPERAFSKVIHNKTVERISEVVGSTVARPDAILSGSAFACLLVLGLYVTAKYYGFALSGFETIAAFVIGWVLGMTFDFLRALFRRKRG